MFGYKKLKIKIKEVFDTQDAFAEAAGMSKTALNLRLNGKVEWKAPEMKLVCDLLQIDYAEMHEFFFTREVQKVELIKEEEL